MGLLKGVMGRGKLGHPQHTVLDAHFSFHITLWDGTGTNTLPVPFSFHTPGRLHRAIIFVRNDITREKEAEVCENPRKRVRKLSETISWPLRFGFREFRNRGEITRGNRNLNPRHPFV